MNGRGIGFIAGLMVGLVIVVILYKVANTDRKIKSEYDERQEKIRGKAYKIAFYTMLLYQALLIGLSIGEVSLPFEPYIAEFIGIFLSCTVLGGYCIWHDVYWGLNNDHKRYYIIFGVCLFLNLFPIVVPALRGEFARNGISGAPVLNILVMIMMAILLTELGIKHLIDKNKKDEED
ncbi:MAG: hypothetical protein K6E63_11725 [Lachnospiraceae bacterium]|nr:hypothetical protein [Lachnospiraceae bacterium]